jgi:ERCC4-related helicase
MESKGDMIAVSITLNFLWKNGQSMIEWTSTRPITQQHAKKLLKIAYQTLQGKNKSLKVVG